MMSTDSTRSIIRETIQQHGANNTALELSTTICELSCLEVLGFVEQSSANLSFVSNLFRNVIRTNLCCTFIACQ